MGLFSSKQKSKSKRTPYRQWQLDRMLDQLGTLAATPMEYFSDQTYAPMQPLQEEALGMREAYAREALPGAIGGAYGAYESGLAAPDVASNPYVQGMIEQQAGLLNRNLQENLLPSIATGAIGAGQYGGTRQGIAEGIALRGTQEALAREAARTQLGAYGAGLGQQRAAMQFAPTMTGLGMMPAEVLGEVGDIQRAEEQRAIDESMQRHYFAQEEPWQRLQRASGMFMPMTTPFAASENVSKTSPSGLQIAGQIAGLGALGAGFGNQMGWWGGSTPSPYGGMSAVQNQASAPWDYGRMYGQYFGGR